MCVCMCVCFIFNSIHLLDLVKWKVAYIQYRFYMFSLQGQTNFSMNSDMLLIQTPPVSVFNYIELN